MRYSKRYIAFTIILVLLFSLKLNKWSDEYAEVEPFRGAQLEDKVFYPLIAKNVNDDGLLTIKVDDQEYQGLHNGFIVNEQMQVMCDLDLIRKIFSCSADVYNNETLMIDRGIHTYEFQKGKKQGTVDGIPTEITAAFEEYDGVYYVALEDLCSLFSYDYLWDDNQYVATVKTTENTLPATLPTSYDLREKNRVSSIKDQGSSSTCWAYAALGALESSLLPEEEKNYSTQHMISSNNFHLQESVGGEYTMAVAYLLSWEGPVADEKKQDVDKHVQEVHFYGEDDIDDIKRAVMQYGGVSTSIYANVTTSNLKGSSYYNRQTNSYCYSGSNKPNHDVVIIGWDDRYSKDKFHSDVPGDGAFICQNSWGSEFGDKGVFYVSYYDTNVGAQCVSYQSICQVDNYDEIYQSDLCGWVGQLGYNKDSIMAANVYEAKDDEKIEAAGFYALGKDTKYQVYMVSKFQGVASLANRQLVAEGTLKDKGYYTIPFDRDCMVSKGDKFAVVISIKTPDFNHPIAVEYQAGNMTKNVDISDGLGYISNNGLDWEQVENKANANLCLKAYSRKQEE